MQILNFVERFWFLGIMLVSLADYVAAYFAPCWYFRTGVVVCRLRYPASRFSQPELLENVRALAPRRIFVRQCDESSFGIRENYLFYILYSAVLHWHVSRSQTGDEWTVVWRLKVYSVIFFILVAVEMFTKPLDRFMVFWLAWGCLVTSSVVAIQWLQIRFLGRLLRS